MAEVNNAELDVIIEKVQSGQIISQSELETLALAASFWRQSRHLILRKSELGRYDPRRKAPK